MQSPWINTPDREEGQKYWTAFWRGELLDRPPVLIHCPLGRDCGPLPEAKDNRHRCCDPDFVLRLSEAALPRALYLGEMVAVSRHLACAWAPVYGGSVRYEDSSVWIEPGVTDWETAPRWETDWDDAGWRLLKDAYGRLCRGAGGRYFVGLPPLLPPNDLLAMLRGTENFLIDLVTEPQRVKDALSVMVRNFARMWNELDALRDRSTGWGNWWPIWCPDRVRIYQSDVSCMFSEAMFEEFIVPELHAAGDDVDHLFYHLDGPGAIRHVEMICSVPKVRAIQWVPGEGQPPHGRHWMGLFHKVQALGRAIWVWAELDDLEMYMRELDPRRLLLSVNVKTPDEAAEVKKRLIEWTARYRRDKGVAK